MPSETTQAFSWDQLHANPRHRTLYPSEHVVRFLAAIVAVDDSHKTAIDIGCGAGRHAKLMEDFGFTVRAVDASWRAVERTRSLLKPEPYATKVAQRKMTDLHDISSDAFQIALSYGVFYYGTADEGHQAVAEMYRVMGHNGKGFVNVRTDRDWRNHGDLTGEPEEGMEMHFLSEDDIPIVYGAFRELSWELTETTTHQGRRLNSDWLISVTK